MNKRVVFMAVAMPIVSVVAEVNPVDTRWTFGAHEPFPMYRRVGRICTGAIEGNALWLKDWLDWWDSSAPAKMKEIGFNYRMSNISAGIGRGQAKVLPLRVEQKRAIYQRYAQQLAGLPLTLQPMAADCHSNCWLSVALLDKTSKERTHCYF